MSATVTSPDVRLPVTRFGGLIAAAMIAIAAAALIGIAVYTFVGRDSGSAAAFDPTGAQRIQFVREYSSAATYDATPPTASSSICRRASSMRPVAAST